MNIKAISNAVRTLVGQLCGTAVLSAVLIGTASAQAFPTKTIRIIVPYAPGSAVDLVPRLLAERMAPDLGQPVVVENKTGGLGVPAMVETLNQPADGHTVLAVDAGHWAINPALQSVNYDFLKDFTPVSATYTSGILFFTSVNSGISSFPELIAKAKAKPGSIAFATPGIGSTHHLIVEMLKSGAGLEMRNIPYRGGPEVVESVLRGDTQFGMSSLNGVLAQLKAGKLKLLAVSVQNRLKSLPDVPTVSEVTGIKDFNFAGTQALVVKNGTPKPIVDRLSAAVRKAGLQPDLVSKVLEATASDMTPNTPEQELEIMRNDIKKYTAAVKIAGVKAQ